MPYIVENDLKTLGIPHEQGLDAVKLSKKELRSIVRDVAFAKLSESMRRSTKMRNTRYSKMEIQPYLKSSTLCQEEMQVLTGLRSMCLRGIKHNFKNMYRQCTHCPLECSIEDPQEDTQEHVLVCTKLGGSNYDLDYVFTDSVQQYEVAQEYSRLMRDRSTQLETKESTTSCCLPGASFLDQSSNHGASVAVL